MSQELTSACPHMHLQHNVTYASQPPMTLLHMPCEAFMRMAWVCVCSLLTMLALSSTDLRPEITSRDTYRYKHLTLHRKLCWCCFKSMYRVIGFVHSSVSHDGRSTFKHADRRPFTIRTLHHPTHRNEQMSIELILFTLTTCAHTRIDTHTHTANSSTQHSSHAAII